MRAVALAGVKIARPALAPAAVADAELDRLSLACGRGRGRARASATAPCARVVAPAVPSALDPRVGEEVLVTTCLLLSVESAAELAHVSAACRRFRELLAPVSAAWRAIIGVDDHRLSLAYRREHSARRALAAASTARAAAASGDRAGSGGGPLPPPPSPPPLHARAPAPASAAAVAACSRASHRADHRAAP